MQIRKMKVDDLDEVTYLEQILFSSPWTKEDFIYEINTNPFGHYVVIENEKQIVGYLGMWLMGDQSQITTIGVNQEMQGQGYGSQLMQYAIDLTCQRKYHNINLEVRVSNMGAIHLYEKYGFKNVALRKNYYEDTHEDAYLMIKEMEV